MKRTFALLLAALLTMAAALPVLADDRVQPPTEPTAASSQAAGVGTDPGTDAPPAASSGQTDAAGPDIAPDGSAPSQPGDAAAPVLGILAADSLQSDSLTAANTADTVHFESLRKAMEKYNYTVLSLKGQIKDVSNIDVLSTTVSLDGGIDALQALARQLNTARSGQTEGDALYIALYATQMLVESQISQMMGSRSSVLDSTESAKNSLNDGINQLIRGAETLYVALAAMEDGLGAMNRGLDSLNRAVAIAEKQQTLGMASAYDVEQLRYQQSQLQSQLESLKYQIASNKVTLEGMCGMALKGTVHLADLPMPTQAELDAVNYDKQLNTAMNRNVDVMNAQLSYNSKTSGTNKNALNGAKSDFASKFKGVCLAIPENVRLVSAAQETVDFQQRSFDIVAKKYELGMASHEEYLAAKGELDSAGDNLKTANRNLFSAYRAYVNATQYGLV